MTPILVETTGATGVVGVPGLEAVHTIRSLTLNDQTPLDQQALGYRFKVSLIRGFHSLPEPEDNRDAPLGQLGEIARRSVRRGKTIVYEGLVQGQSLTLLRRGESALQGVLADLTPTRVDVVPHPDYSLTAWYFTARPLDNPMDDEQSFSPHRIDRGFARPFVAALRLGDPRFYRADAPAQVTSGTTGTADRDVTVNNEGTAPTPAVLTVTGPTTTPWSVQNVELGESILFSTALTAAQVLTIDFAARTILLGATDWRGKRSMVSSGWWDSGVEALLPGSQTIRGSGINDGGSLGVSWKHASWS
ncbi:MAG: phage tail family protein [Actinomycetota bacterium]|nr:phage tail family protein [Actinomycetota bacterium]